jgi:transglutaminase-like putative cysteine protease
MRFSVRHETFYRYSTPVRLASHVLRLNPRADGGRLRTACLTVDPAPAARHDSTDRFGNRLTHVSFDGLSDFLRIENLFDLEILAATPLRDPGLLQLPWSSNPHDQLADYRRDAEHDAAVEAFAAALASECGWAALPFLEHLSQTLFTRLERRIRVEGAAQAPADTLAIGSGACRDITVLFMATCRSLGIPARFVSGYQAHADTPDGQRHLHAWPEVFLPGLGWRGFDPTHGIAVTDGHVALCAAPEQADTMPVEGGFYAGGVTATLDYHVQITTT